MSGSCGATWGRQGRGDDAHQLAQVALRLAALAVQSQEVLAGHLLRGHRGQQPEAARNEFVRALDDDLDDPAGTGPRPGPVGRLADPGGGSPPPGTPCSAHPRPRRPWPAAPDASARRCPSTRATQCVTRPSSTAISPSTGYPASPVPSERALATGRLSGLRDPAGGPALGAFEKGVHPGVRNPRGEPGQRGAGPGRVAPRRRARHPAVADRERPRRGGIGRLA